MALSRIDFPGDGVTTQFSIPFALGYLSRSDVTARVGEEMDGLGEPVYRQITWISDTFVEISGSPAPVGSRTRFERTVPRTELVVDFEDGAIMNEENLNTMQKQAIMLAHEIIDGRFESFLDSLDLGGNDIYNVGTLHADDIVINGEGPAGFLEQVRDQVHYAEEWAQSPDPISTEAGGDGVTDQSSKTWALYSEDQADRSELNADRSQGNADDAASYAGYRDFINLSAMLSNTTLAYGTGPGQVQAGDAIRLREEDFVYTVVGPSDPYVFIIGTGVRVVYKPTHGVVFPEALNIPTDGSNSAPLFNVAQQIAASNGCRVESLSTGTYAFLSNVQILVDTNIRCTVEFPADNVTRNIDLGTATTYDTLDFGDLGGLTVFSDRITGLPAGAHGRYLEISSDEVLTERITGGTPYYNKLTSVYILDADGRISPTLDMTFNSGYTVDVRLMHKEKSRLKVKFQNLHCTSASGELLTSIRLNRDDTDLEIGSLSSAGAQYRTSINVLANGCTVKDSHLSDSQYEGLGYGVSIGLSCNTLIEGLRGAENRHLVSGRHGSNITIRDCIMSSCDTHWSNGFTVLNSILGYIAFSGKDLTVRDCKFNRDSYAILNRSDISYAIGNCILDSIDLSEDVTYLLYGVEQYQTTSGFFSTPRRMFDNISISNIFVRNAGTFRLFSDMYVSAVAEGAVEYIPARYMNIDKVYAPYCSSIWALYRANVHLWPNLGFVPEMNIRDVYVSGSQELVRITGTANTNNNKFNLLLEHCVGEINPWVLNGAVNRMRAEDCDISIRGSAIGTVTGHIIIDTCRFRNNDFTEPAVPTLVYNSMWLSNSSMQYTVGKRSGCVVPAGGQAAWASDYTNPTYYAT